MVRVGINGFGRIGRAFFRAAYNDPDIDIVAINSRTGPEKMYFLLQHDTVYGNIGVKVGYTKEELIVNNKRIKFTTETDPTKIPWKRLGVDVVIESTGIFDELESARKHLIGGAKKVLISAPSKTAEFDIVYGVNNKLYDKERHNVISNESCTTNCLAPLVKVLNDKYGIETGFMVTVHAATASQSVVDDSPKEKDIRRARAVMNNIIPTTTGATDAVVRVIPEMRNKLHGTAIRVPVSDGSLVSFAVNLKKDVTSEEINNLFLEKSKKEFKGIIEYTDLPLVSSDIVGNPHSAIVDSLLTRVLEKRLVHIFAWYDNEFGYVSRLKDVCKIL